MSLDTDRYRTIRRASGAPMAAGCFPARRESSILQPKTAPHASRHREGKTRHRREGILRKPPPQERRPPYRRYMSRWPCGQTMSWTCPSFSPRHPGERRVFRQVVWQTWKFPPFLLYKHSKKAVPMSSVNRLAAVPGFSRPRAGAFAKRAQIEPPARSLRSTGAL